MTPRPGPAIAALALLVVAALGWQTVPVDATAPATTSTSISTPTTAAPAPPEPVLDGAALFRSKGCAACHDSPTAVAMVGGFPSLAAASAWAGDRRDGVDAETYLAESIREPAAFRSPAFAGGAGPVAAMPDLELSEPEIVALVQFLLTG